MLFKAALLAGMAVLASSKPVLDYEINLDLSPEDRYLGLFNVPGNAFNATVWKFWDVYFAGHQNLVDVLYGIVDKRGQENEEMQREINGLAAASKLPLQFVQGIQMLYEIQTLMVPIVNFTGPGVPAFEDYPEFWFPEGYEVLADIPWRGPGCTGIIALNKADGTVNHARNLDFAPVDIMYNLVYNGIFTRGGIEVFRAQMIAGYVMPITGANFVGDDGYAIERNTRYADHVGGGHEMITNLLSGRELNGWQLRTMLETETTFAGALEYLSTVPYASTEYAILSGVKKGSILARDPDGVAHVQTLGQENYHERADYIIMTNFDYYWHDVREWFDPTGGLGVFHPRRVEAQKELEKHLVLTPDVLFDTINNVGVFADTIFQAIINVEKKVWNVSQPDDPNNPPSKN